MQNRFSLMYYDVVLFWVGVVSAFNIIMLCIGKFSPSIVLISGTAAVIMALVFGKIRLIRDTRLNLVVILLLIIAILPRADIFTHYSGGQDQGLYVNMSATMTKSGSVDFTDRLRESLPDNMKARYDSFPLAGVGYVDNPQKSTYSVDFYPMHPAWMACFTFLFGEGKHTLSLLFFSLLGLLGMYLLTMELTGDDKKAGYITLLFGAVNPGLVFLSKFPVGEMVALCFSVNGFYLLLRAFKCDDKRLRYLFLIGSGLLFTAFFYTRMTFPLLLPVFFLALCIVFFFKKYFYMRIWISIYTISLTIMFFLSWVFYYRYQPNLANPMYRLAFKPVVDKFGIFALVGIFIMLVLFFLVSRIKYREKLCSFAEGLTSWLENHAAMFFFGAIALSVFSLVRLYTKGYVPPQGGMIEPYSLIFHFHSLYVYMLLLSPVLLLVLLVLPFIRLKLQRCQILLVFFLTSSWLAVLIQTPNISYLYYYGRYLLSEMVPYSLIMCGIVLATLMNKSKWRGISITITCLAVMYFAVFSVIQVGKPESEDPQVLYSIDNIVGKEDVIAYENGSSKLATPLRLYFDKQVYLLDDKIKLGERYSEINYFFENSGSKYGNIYMLENNPLSLLRYGNSIELVGKYDYSNGALRIPYEYAESNLNDIKAWTSLLLPTIYYKEMHSVYLYRMEKKLELMQIPLSNFNIDFARFGNSDLFDLSGISSQEETMRWTIGEKAVISAQILDSKKPVSKCQIKIIAGMYTGGKSTQCFGVIVNGTEVGWADSAGGEFSFDVPAKLVNGVGNLTIEILTPDAHSPSSTGENSDTRVLGLCLKRIQLVVSYEM